MQDPEGAYALGEAVARVIYQPIKDSYRLTVEPMALLEQGLSETVCATLLQVTRRDGRGRAARRAEGLRARFSCSAT